MTPDDSSGYLQNLYDVTTRIAFRKPLRLLLDAEFREDRIFVVKLRDVVV